MADGSEIHIQGKKLDRCCRRNADQRFSTFDSGFDLSIFRKIYGARVCLNQNLLFWRHLWQK